MSSQSILTVKDISSPERRSHSCQTSAPSFFHNIFKSKYKTSLSDDGSLSLTSKSFSNKDELLSAKSPHKPLMSTESERPISHVSNPNFSDAVFSRCSTFCTSLYSSSSTSLEPCKHMSSLPFLPHPSPSPKSVQRQQQSSIFSGDGTSSEMVDVFGEDEQCDDDVKDFLNLSGGDTDVHGGTCAQNSLALNEQMDFQILSEQLGISFTDNEESPCLDVSFYSFIFISLFFLIRFISIDDIHVLKYRIYMRFRNKQPLLKSRQVATSLNQEHLRRQKGRLPKSN